jgi:hypothetical protein
MNSVSLGTSLPGGPMRTFVVLFAALAVSSCSSPVAESRPTVDPDVALGDIPGCYTVQPEGTPAADVSLPSLIELSPDPAPLFVDPGRFAVREPGNSGRRAPISWWAPGAGDSIELVLGGGYTGYSFSLRPAGHGSWAGEGKYFADFGVLPEPGPLPLRLAPRGCS